MIRDREILIGVTAAQKNFFIIQKISNKRRLASQVVCKSLVQSVFTAIGSTDMRNTIFLVADDVNSLLIRCVKRLSCQGEWKNGLPQ